MSQKFVIALVLIFCTCGFITSAPIETELESPNPANGEDTYYEIQELKRVVRQCPFSAMAGGAGGPDMGQLLNIAQTVLTALNAANGGGGGFGNGVGGVGGVNQGVDTNQIARLMQQRRRF